MALNRKPKKPKEKFNALTIEANITMHMLAQDYEEALLVASEYLKIINTIKSVKEQKPIEKLIYYYLGAIETFRYIKTKSPILIKKANVFFDLANAINLSTLNIQSMLTEKKEEKTSRPRFLEEFFVKSLVGQAVGRDSKTALSLLKEYSDDILGCIQVLEGSKNNECVITAQTLLIQSLCYQKRYDYHAHFEKLFKLMASKVDREIMLLGWTKRLLAKPASIEESAEEYALYTAAHLFDMYYENLPEYSALAEKLLQVIKKNISIKTISYQRYLVQQIVYERYLNNQHDQMFLRGIHLLNFLLTEKERDDSAIEICYNIFSRVFLQQNNIEQAKRYLDKALEYTTNPDYVADWVYDVIKENSTTVTMLNQLVPIITDFTEDGQRETLLQAVKIAIESFDSVRALPDLKEHNNEDSNPLDNTESEEPAVIAPVTQEEKKHTSPFFELPKSKKISKEEKDAQYALQFSKKNLKIINDSVKQVDVIKKKIQELSDEALWEHDENQAKQSPDIAKKSEERLLEMKEQMQNWKDLETRAKKAMLQLPAQTTIQDISAIEFDAKSEIALIDFEKRHETIKNIAAESQTQILKLIREMKTAESKIKPLITQINKNSEKLAKIQLDLKRIEMGKKTLDSKYILIKLREIRQKLRDIRADLNFHYGVLLDNLYDLNKFIDESKLYQSKPLEFCFQKALAFRKAQKNKFAEFDAQLKSAQEITQLLVKQYQQIEKERNRVVPVKKKRVRKQKIEAQERKVETIPQLEKPISELKLEEKHLPDSFEIEDVRDALTTGQIKGLNILHVLQQQLKNQFPDIKSSLQGSFVERCAMRLVNKDPIAASDIDTFIAINQSQFIEFDLILQSFGFMEKKFESDSLGRFEKVFYNYELVNGKEGDDDYYQIQITATLPNYKSSNSLLMTAATLSFDDNPTKCVLKFNPEQKPMIEHCVQNSLLPIAKPDINERGFANRVLKSRAKGKRDICFVPERNKYVAFTNKEWNALLLEYYRSKFEGNNPKAGFECYASLKRAIKEGHFTLPDAEPIIFNFCFALIEKQYPSISSEVIEHQAVTLTIVLQELYKIHLDLADSFFDILQTLVSTPSMLTNTEHCIMELTTKFEKKTTTPTTPFFLTKKSPNSYESKTRTVENPVLSTKNHDQLIPVTHSYTRSSIDEVKEFYEEARIVIGLSYQHERVQLYTMFREQMTQLCSRLKIHPSHGDGYMDEIHKTFIIPKYTEQLITPIAGTDLSFYPASHSEQQQESYSSYKSNENRGQK